MALFPRASNRISAALALAFALASTSGPAGVAALSPIDPSTLTPVPSSLYQCHGVAGAQVRCDFNVDFVIDPFPIGFTCGEGSLAFEVWDGGETIHQVASRFFDADGKLIKKISHETFLGATWRNPGSGTSVRYTQSNTIIDTYTVPGDVTSAIEPTNGNAAIFLVPGGGSIVLNAGRSVWAWDPAVDDLAFVSSSGPQAFVEAFVQGNLEVLQPICDALAA